MPKNRILVVASFAGSLIHFRGDFIKSLIKEGYKVFAAAPDISPEISKALIAIGATPVEFRLQRTGLNPFKDLQTIVQLKNTLKTYQINLVFPYTIKPVIYSSIAARLAVGIPVVSLITGLGFTFSASSLKSKVLQRVTEVMYKIALKKNKVIIFQNEDDRQLFLDRRLLHKNQRTAIVSGSGVHLSNYPFRVNDKQNDKLIFVLVARLIREKGIHLYIDAATTLKKDFPNAEFHVIGTPDQSPSAIKMEKLLELHKNGTIVYHGHQKKVADFLYNSDVFVLPTYYREGVPRSILEALSVGLPIITTNSPGCRETVIEGENGFLITPKSETSLLEAMQALLNKPSQIKPMGLASRHLAETKFDVDLINQELLKILTTLN